MFLKKLVQSLHQNRSLIHCALLLLVIVFYSYLRSRYLETNNWKADVGYCFAEVGKCMSDGSRHGIVKYTREADPEANSLPVCYSLPDANGDETICYSNLVALSCAGAMWDAHNPVDMKTLFSGVHSGENYILYDVAILILSVLVLIMYVLFSTKNSYFVSNIDGAFSSGSDSKKMKLMCNALMIVQVVLMFVSSHSFSLIRVVSCGLDEKATHQGNRRHRLSSRSENLFDNDKCHCNSNIRSIISPDDFVVSNYATLSLLLAVACLCSAIYSMFYRHAENNGDDDPEHINETRDADGNESHSMESESFRYLTRTLSGNIAARRYTAAAARAGQRQMAAEVFQDHTTFKKRNEGKMGLWKFGYRACGIDPDSNGDEECAVCLEPLVGGAASASGGTSGRKLSSRSAREGAGGRGSRGRARVVPFESGAEVADNTSVSSAVDVEAAGQRGQQAVVHHQVKGDADTAPVKLPCGHCFHERCICAWMRANSTCPICRADLETGRGGSE